MTKPKPKPKPAQRKRVLRIAVAMDNNDFAAYGSSMEHEDDVLNSLGCFSDGLYQPAVFFLEVAVPDTITNPPTCRAEIVEGK